MVRADSLPVHALALLLSVAFTACGDDTGGTTESTGTSTTGTSTTGDASSSSTTDASSSTTAAESTSTSGGLNGCEMEQERIIAKFASCGLDVTPKDLSMCDAALEAAKKCEADCTEASSCAGLDGSDPGESQTYADCAGACV